MLIVCLPSGTTDKGTIKITGSSEVSLPSLQELKYMVRGKRQEEEMRYRRPQVVGIILSRTLFEMVNHTNV